MSQMCDVHTINIKYFHYNFIQLKLDTTDQIPYHVPEYLFIIYMYKKLKTHTYMKVR
jgi:hypothetical protein